MYRKTELGKGRREFMKQSLLVSLGFVGLSRYAFASANSPYNGFMDLLRDPAEYLDLPEGFTYKIISRAGDKMDDGLLVPAKPDGMGAFRGATEGQVILVRNHENSPGSLDDSPFGSNNELLSKLDANRLYDAGRMQTPSLGGTTTLVFDEGKQQIEKQYLSLAGTNRNCAGGVTPWGSWLSCEEDVTTIGGNVEKDHGFVFEVPSTRRKPIDPVPIKEMGRFNHEAVAVDPETGIVYQTEDRHDGLIYRYIPKVKGKLHKGGRLQALALKDAKSFDTRNWDAPLMQVNRPMKVDWVEIENVLSPKDDLRLRGFEKGATRFARGEGIWFGERELYFACTNGGPNQYGQVFRYRLSPEEGSENDNSAAATLELFAESRDKGVLHMCDNLTIAPWGDLILSEDNGELNHIRGIRPNGEVYTFATNKSSGSEFAGAVFSPSGKTLFVNIQANGETLAITGPWKNLS
ncbi:MAG TPA: alkaline phosphatase PhoX [Pricia sp.]|nr:alkaline phosphatase PhoX [Pricia sp.]